MSGIRERCAIARAADQALQDYGQELDAAGVDWETPEFTRLNRAAYDSMRAVPWWARGWRFR
jgi:hypothetical protein